MAYFECIVGNGGGSAVGNTLIVACDADFAGTTISCSKSGTTYTKTCPSSSPYTVEFNGLDAGTWTVSGSVSGQSYSTSVVIADNTTTLSAGFNYRAWVTAGGLDPTDYSSLSDVFADEAAVRRLMLVHASADYLIDAVTADVDTLDDFVANDTAMKWLGLCDYVCDGIVAVTGAETKLLASTYWERYLKDHVPVMNSNTAPYGEASATASGTNNAPWKAFNESDTKGWNSGSTAFNNRVQYHFVNPIIPKKAKVKFVDESARTITHTVKFVASNDGTTWVDISEEVVTGTINQWKEVNLTATQSYSYVGIVDINSPTGHGASAGDGIKLQFYGRALNVSVPVMTSNTAPFGEASASRAYSTNLAWKAFDGDESTYWMNASATSAVNDYITYKFTSKVVIKKVYFSQSLADANYVTKIAYKCSNDGVNWETIVDNQEVNHGKTVFDTNNDIPYQYHRIQILAVNASPYGYILLQALQFYGVDYSEKEFETGTTKKWLYDHGVELETFTAWESGTVVRENSQIGYSKNANVNGGLTLTNALDLTPWDLLRAKVGDDITIANTELAVTGFTPYRIITTSDMPNNAYLDISTVDETKNIIICANAQASSGKFTMAEMWLEP